MQALKNTHTMANMNERDIPSVPITTLAGVASLTGCKYEIIYLLGSEFILF